MAQYQPGLGLPQGSQPGMSMPLCLALFGGLAYAGIAHWLPKVMLQLQAGTTAPMTAPLMTTQLVADTEQLGTARTVDFHGRPE